MTSHLGTGKSINLFYSVCYLLPVWKEVLKKLDDLGLVPGEDGRHRLHVLGVRHEYLEHVEGLRQIILLGKAQNSFRYHAKRISLLEKVFPLLHSIFTFMQQIFPLVHIFPFLHRSLPDAENISPSSAVSFPFMR